MAPSAPVVKLVAVLLLAYTIHVAESAPAATTDSTYAAPDGHYCLKCPIGTKIVKHCTVALTQPTCEPCLDHHYSDVPNAEMHCTLCKTSCPPESSIVHKCSPSTNLKCQCHTGYHSFPTDHIDNFYECRQHTACPPGQGEDYYGNHTHDTKCEKCEEGVEFVDQSDPVHPKCATCSACPPGDTVINNCSLYNDTVCSNNVTFTSTSPTTEDQSDGSDSLSGGEIAGIVIASSIVIIAIIAIVFWYLWKRRQQKSQETSGPDRNGKGKDSGAVPLLDRNGKDKDSDAVLLLERRWSQRFIEGKVFLLLSMELGEEWQNFMHALQGWGSLNVNAVIGYKKEEEMTVPNRIRGCLSEWLKQCPPVSVATNIREALRAVDREDLVEKLQTMYSREHPAANGDGEVFQLLSKELGEEWQNFIHRLQGWGEEVNVNTIINHKKEEQQTVPNRIIGCLSEWLKQCPPDSVPANLSEALRAVERVDLVEKVQEIYDRERPTANGDRDS